MKILRALTVLLIAAASTAHAAENCRAVNMGFNPAQDSAAVLVSGSAIARYLETRIRGVQIKTTVAQDYQALVEATRSGKLDFAWLSPVSYVQAHDQARAQVLLKSVRNGGPYYWAAFVVRKDSGIKNLNDMRGKTIAWIDPNSAAGYTFPRATLVAKGINPDTFFSKQTFAGKHDAAVLALANGSVDVIATFSNNTQGTSGSWTQYLSADKAAALMPVVYSKPIPGDTLSVFVYQAPQLSVPSLPVRPDGRISMPLIPDINAAGKTPTALAKDIEARLKEYVKQPNVSVIVSNFVGPLDRQIRVIGEATEPLAIPYRDGMTVLDVMIQTKGLTRFAAGNSATIARTTGNQRRTIRVRLSDLLRDGDIDQNVAMMPGDTLIIPQSWF